MSQTPSLWTRWKSLRLPWRRQWIVGQDLTGVTFWEHKHNPLNANKPRRTASYPRAVHPSDVLLTPAWIQWLRHTRVSPPSIAEQHGELARQAQLKQLAAAADERWKAKKSYLDRPQDTGQAPAEILEPRDRGGYGQVDPRGLGTPGSRDGTGKALDEQQDSSGMVSLAGNEEEVIKAAAGEDVVKGRFKGPSGPNDPRERDSNKANRGIPREKKANPWEKNAPAGEYQPATWTPPPASRR